MMQKAWSNIEEVPYCFSRSSVKFQDQLSNPSNLPCYTLRFNEVDRGVYWYHLVRLSVRPSVRPSVTSKTARWFHSKKNESFTKEDIFSMIDLVIDNSFFTFGDKVFRQSIGIPMGIDPAPQMANLYLYYYEAKFMEMLTKENYSAAKKFNYTRRFIDDLHTLNNDGHLEENNNMGRIYPQELKLNQENKNDDKATFLDLEEQIKDACIEVKTYDKRDAFKFEIINYPDLSGNIPTKPAYGVFTSQVIRYARICSKKVDLLERVKSLTKKLLRKHYTINGLKSSLKKCLKKHRWITTKLGPRLHQNLTEE